MSSDTLLKILGGNFRDTSQPILEGLAQQNPEIFLKAIKSLLKIPSIRSEGHNFLKPIFNAFYGRMPQNKDEAKKVNKIVQDIYFNLAINQLYADNEKVYYNAYSLAKNKEEEFNDYNGWIFCCPPCWLVEGHKGVKNIIKEKSLCGFTLPKKPEDMILKYSQHRSPQDILKNYGKGNDDGLTNLANAINELEPNKIKEFLQNLYKNDLSKDKSKFEELVYKISQSNEDLKGKLEKIEFNTGNTGIASKIFSCFKNTPKKPSIKIAGIIVRGALKAEVLKADFTSEGIKERCSQKIIYKSVNKNILPDLRLDIFNEGIPDKDMVNKIINPREYKTLQQKTMTILDGV